VTELLSERREQSRENQEVPQSGWLFGRRKGLRSYINREKAAMGSPSLLLSPARRTSPGLAHGLDVQPHDYQPLASVLSRTQRHHYCFFLSYSFIVFNGDKKKLSRRDFQLSNGNQAKPRCNNTTSGLNPKYATPPPSLLTYCEPESPTRWMRG
jgi:hypothetical protein